MHALILKTKKIDGTRTRRFKFLTHSLLSVLFSIPSDSRIASVQLSIRQQLNCSEKGAYIKLYSNKGDQNCETESKDFSEKTLSDDKHGMFLEW